jgi:hypothetical protein
MSGITYGQWQARMSSQVAAESVREHYDLKTQMLKLENQKLKEELLKLQKDNEQIDREQQLRSDRWA